MEGYIAEIRLFAATFAPRNWAYCAGQIMSIAQNTALFSLLGTTYGGNGQTTFGLPDFRSRVAVGTGTGAGLSNYQLGEMGGSETNVMTTNQMPQHNHGAPISIPLSNAASGTQEVNGASLLATAPENLYFNATSAGVAMVSQTVPSSIAGSGVPFNMRQPYLGMNYIICQYGIFPSRN